MTLKQHYNIYIAACEKEGGIYLCNINDDGVLTCVEKYDLDSPMYLAVSNNKMYAILRNPFENSVYSGLVSLDILNDGRLGDMSQMQSTMGEVACHLCVDDDVYCVNYISGSVIKMPDTLVTHEGASVHPQRQTSPHTHQVIFTPDKKYVCVVDLGIDTIVVYDRNLNLFSKANVPQGYGSRHMVFSPDGKYAFCINELKSSVTVFSYKDGVLTPIKTYDAVPEDFEGQNTGAAIRITSDGKYLYASNRGHDSIACFEVDEDKLSLIEYVSCGGSSPRDFNITPDGKFVICTNENSGNVTVFEIINGRLKKVSEQTGFERPLCVIFN